MKRMNSIVDQLLASRPDEVVSEWLAEVAATGRAGASGAGGALQQREAVELLKAFHRGVHDDADFANLDAAAWEPVRSVLEALSQSRAAQGGNAGDTSHFVLALKKPLFVGLRQSLAADSNALFDAVWEMSKLLDKLAQWTTTTFQRSREDVIRRQQDELLELSTPVIKLWDGVLAVPMIGTLDSNRTQLVMEALLQRIVDTGSELAIIDITGVPTVDTLVAQHLLKTVTAIRLMGADCIISGVRPQIAQTIVHLGIDLQGITTKASLADALALALKRGGYVVTRAKA